MINKDGSITVKWCPEDVQAVRPDLSVEQAKEVLVQAHRRHDASEGINWTVLECHADDLFPKL